MSPLTEIEIAVSPGFDEADALALADTDAPGLPVWLVELGDGDDDGLLEPESPLRDTEPHALSTSAAAQVVTATRRKRTASSFPRTSGFRAYVASHRVRVRYAHDPLARTTVATPTCVPRWEFRSR